MHLLKATADFKITGQPKAGFPIVLYEDMSSCEEANLFLRHYLARGQIGSKASWEPTGRAMYDYFGFLEAHDLLWTDVDRGEAKTLVAAYRDYCFETEGLARNTVRQRIMYICEFYKFAQRRGWVLNLPYEWEERTVLKTGGFLAHVDASGGKIKVRSVMPRKHKTLPKYLTGEQCISLLAAPMNVHHRTLIRLALGSGLRRQELATFPSSSVFDPDTRPGKACNVRVQLDPDDGTGMKTKGSKERTIYITRRLMKDLYHYKQHYRGERASIGSGQQLPLFLNQDGEPFADDGKGIERQISDIGKRVGIKAHPHMLRHTYATQTLIALQRQPPKDRKIEPVVFLQKQLGHASITTTMVYLHLANDIADDAVLAYSDELDDWADHHRGEAGS